MAALQETPVCVIPIASSHCPQIARSWRCCVLGVLHPNYRYLPVY